VTRSLSDACLGVLAERHEREGFRRRIRFNGVDEALNTYPAR